MNVLNVFCRKVVFLSSLQPYYYYPDLSFSCGHKTLVRTTSSSVGGIFAFCFKPFLCAGPAERSGWKSLQLWHESWSLGLRFRSSGRALSSLVQVCVQLAQLMLLLGWLAAGGSYIQRAPLPFLLRTGEWHMVPKESRIRAVPRDPCCIWCVCS